MTRATAMYTYQLLCPLNSSCRHAVAAKKYVTEFFGSHLSHVQDVVDVLQEAFVLQLVVTEQEDSGGAVRASLAQHCAQVLPPLTHAIALADLYGEKRVLCHEGGNSGQTLPTAASNSNLQQTFCHT